MTDLYRTQRAMRKMRRAAIQRGVVAVLDIGTSKVTCLILRFDPPNPDEADESFGILAGQAQFRVIGAATTRSRGVRFGEVDAMGETERAIRTAVQSAQKAAGVCADHVIAAFSGARPRSYGLAGTWQVPGPAITEQDIARVLAACDLPDLGDGREVLHAHPVNFALDGRTGLGDPRGQIGRVLAVDMHLMSVDAAAVECLLHCLRRCDLEVAGLASSAYLSGLAALVEDEQEMGAAAIDMGGGSTGISVFLKKHLIHADSVRLGGDHISADIAKGLGIPLATAERIKTFHGGVQAIGMDDREMIEIGADSGDWEKDRRRISRTELIGIVRPRVEEILEEVRARLDAAGFEHLPGQQLVLTGGASQTPGLDGLAARILGQRVRLGRPMRVPGLPQATTGPAFAAAVGLCLFAARPQDEWWDFETLAPSYPARSLRRAARWLRQNW
jgi:cell division protein FtsA